MPSWVVFFYSSSTYNFLFLQRCKAFILCARVCVCIAAARYGKPIKRRVDLVRFLHVCGFGDKQTCSTHLSTVLHLSHMGTSEQWAAKIQPFVFYPWAWNHIKAKQHASVGGKGFEPQGQGSSTEQRKASQEREGERAREEELKRERELM